jgi:digeranylgeranylglycerophospholipid reductase
MRDDNNRTVTIIGGSFAGLATAHFICEGDVQILERQSELGKMQRSTCCTSLGWIERLGCREAILKKIDHVTIYSSEGIKARIKLPETFCTVNYRVFCETLAGGLRNAEVRTGEKVVEIKGGNSVFTSSGRYNGRVVVDASGWPGLTNRLIRRYTRWNSKPAFGLEVETDYSGDMDSLHIFYGKRYIPSGYGWVFPTGEDRARIGLGGHFSLNPHVALDHFLSELDINRNGATPHGGHLPVLSLGEPIRKGVFVVGDACNQVIPASGEGIRKAFEYSEICGQIVNQILRGEQSLEEGLKEYSQEVLKKKNFYDKMLFIQNLAQFCPEFARKRIVKSLSNVKHERAEYLLNKYLEGSLTAPMGRILKTVIGGIL